jgi:hypothetical protein
LLSKNRRGCLLFMHKGRMRAASAGDFVNRLILYGSPGKTDREKKPLLRALVKTNPR